MTFGREANLKIGIIGAGNMGRSLGTRWAREGHDVLFSSRDLEKSTAIAASASNSSRAGGFDAAASHGDVVLYTVRGLLPSQLLKSPQALAGKIVIDCNNRDLGDDSRPEHFRFDLPLARPSLTEQLSAEAHGARIVKAFSTIPHRIIELEREKIASHGISVFLCSDDAEAKAVVRALAEELGFVGVDSGRLEHAWLVDAVADFVRFQGGAMGRGAFIALSLQAVSSSDSGPAKPTT